MKRTLLPLILAIAVVVTSMGINNKDEAINQSKPTVENVADIVSWRESTERLTVDEARWLVMETVKKIEGDKFNTNLLIFEGAGSYEYGKDKELLETYDFYYCDEYPDSAKSLAKFAFQVHTATGLVINNGGRGDTEVECEPKFRLVYP